MTLENENFDHCGKYFVIKSCSVSDDSIDWVIYNYTKSCTNEFIKLSVDYNTTLHMWQIEHILFLLGGPSGDTYTLSCQISVCDASKSQSDCVAVADACLGGISALQDPT